MVSSSNRATWRSALVALSSALVLAACGGGGGDASGSSTQGSAVGTVTGFGSLIVDGVRYDDSSARYVMDSPEGAPDASSSVEAKLGQRVELRFQGEESSSSTSSVAVSAEVVGLVTATSPDLVVAGQTIRINTDPAAGPVTVFDGYTSAADIQVGHRIEVHGTPVDASTVLASRIERKPSLANWVRVTGNLSNLAADGSSFRLGTLTVLVDAATRVSPAGATLVEGRRVTVWSRTAPVADTITASFIRVKRPLPDGALEVRLAGAVTDCTAPCAGSFKVAGFSIDASTARFGNGNATDLANGRWVELRGRVDATSGVFIANEVRFRRGDDDRNDARLIGSIADFVDMQHFKVRGVSVTTDASTRFGALCPSPLANGTLVAITGSIADATVLAKRVECLAGADGVTIEGKGTIATVDATAKTFTLGSSFFGNLTLRWTDTTVFPEGKSAADLAAGLKVRVRGTVDGTSMTVARVWFDDDVPNPNPGVTVYETEGVASSLVTTGGSVSAIQVNGLTIVVASTTVIELRDGPLVEGAKVKVVFVKQGGANVALFVRTDD